MLPWQKARARSERSMKAIRAHKFGGPENLILEEVGNPVAGPGEVVIDIRAAGVNPSDVYMLSGAYALVPNLPYIPGYDAAGQVSAVGQGVKEFSTGDRVLTCPGVGKQEGKPDLGITGCFAEKLVRKAADIRALPDNVSFSQGAAIGVPYATAHHALFLKGCGQAGETVFIHGASGAVGTAAIQLAKRAGLKVIGSAGSDKGLALVRELGADLAVNHKSENYLEEVREASDGGPQMIIEMLANVNLATDLDLLAKYGRVVVVGARAEVTINPRVMMMKELDVRGLALFNATRKQSEEIIDDLVDGLADGSLNPIIGAEMPLGDAAQAFKRVMDPGAYGKLVLTI